MNKNLVYRALTAFIGGSVALAAIILSPFGLWVFCTVVSLVGLWEYLTVVGVKKRRYTYTSLLIGSFFWIIILFSLLTDDLTGLPKEKYVGMGVLIFPILSLIALFYREEKLPLQTLSLILFGIIYCYLPLHLLFQLSVPEVTSEYNFWVPIGILLMTWFLDSGAYFAGKWIGKHPLFPRISPNKTWEGTVGGTVICLITGAVFEYFLPSDQYSWLIIAGIICVFSQLGDLIESMFKRSIQVKDSGNILPGHGGMLDRFDGIYLSVPFLYLYFLLI